MLQNCGIGAHRLIQTIDKVIDVLWRTVRLLFSLSSKPEQDCDIGPHIAPIHFWD